MRNKLHTNRSIGHFGENDCKLGLFIAVVMVEWENILRWLRDGNGGEQD